MSNGIKSDIFYTIVDEAPELASASLLPIIKFFTNAAGVTVETMDISLAARIIAAFPETLTDAQKKKDDLDALGIIVKEADANVIKLPNISASVPQLVAAIQELQGQGFSIPGYPEYPKDKNEKNIRARYDAIKGSAVNPTLREGNSDRRAARSIKNYAKKNPHSMGSWQASSKTHVSSMDKNDFRSNELSVTLSDAQAGLAKIEFSDDNGKTYLLKDNIELLSGTVVDATFMSVSTLRKFLREEIAKAKLEGTLFSVHLKATMMKVSDPIIFGHVISVFFEEAFEKHGDKLAELGVQQNSGLGDILERIQSYPDIVADFESILQSKAALYMVDSERGITNLHVPSDVIIDASMPAIIRAGGIGWGPDGNYADTKCIIPDNTYAPVYDETINYFKRTGSLDPTTIGTVANVGLMARKAEEYGSHATTFEMPSNGTVKYILANGETLHEQVVAKGDIWRSSKVEKEAIIDWIYLGIERQAKAGSQAIFWLDKARPHDAEIIKYVEKILDEQGNSHKFSVLSPRAATRLTLETIRKGRDSIAITGNVLRDYLTDLFPILELGTSAKMLSIVKLMNGGGLFETGAGGSAPKHVQQLLKENHLRWDSLGEFCALAESLNFLANVKDKPKAAVLGEAVEVATQRILDNNKSPAREVHQTDNRESHYFFALYWAEALARQEKDAELSEYFSHITQALSDNQQVILSEISSVKGVPVDIGGYFNPDRTKLNEVMRPSATLNSIIQ